MPKHSMRISDAERRANWEKLMEAINALLADDETPAFVHNGLVEFIVDLCDATRVNVFSPEVLGAAMSLAFERALTGQSLLK